MDARDRDRLDRWLDEGLRQSMLGEPRAGLEGRILAGVALASKREPARKSWAWIFATATIAGLFALLGLGIGHNRERAAHPATPRGTPHSLMAGGAALPAPASRRLAVPSRSRRKPAPAMAKTEEPKLEHFPSRRPLSQQEMMLASYAERFPAEAALIARDQQKVEQEIAEAQEEAEKDSSRSNQ